MTNQKKSVRDTAHEWAGAAFGQHVDAAALRMHKNRSLHTHTLGVEDDNHGACPNCFYDAGMAVQALRLAGLLNPPHPREITWHGLKLYMGETPFDVEPQLLVEVDHDPSCSTLPAGACCWYDLNAKEYSGQAPHEVGLYRVRIAHQEVGDHLGEFSHVDEYLEVEQFDETSGAWKPWTPEPTKPYGYVLWDVAGRLRVMTMERAALDAWQAENADHIVTNLELLDEADYKTLTHLLVEIRWSAKDPGIKDVFHARLGKWPTPPCGWAAWAPDGALIAFGIHVPGETGWRSLGIGDPAEGVVLDGLGTAHYKMLQDTLDTENDLRHVGAREIFLRKRAELDRTTYVPRSSDGRLMNHGDLTGVVADALSYVARMDSAEGSIRWQPSGHPEMPYVVNASYRVGTRRGQGGSVVIGAEPPRG